MAVNTTTKKTFSAPPKSFADLMNIYESNYIRLRLLCGDIYMINKPIVSKITGRVPIEIKALEQTSHTTILHITYLFKDLDRRPDLKVQIYHDSRQADVISRQCRITGAKIHSWEKQIDSTLLCKWRLNRFLFKWLNLMQHQKHSFKQHTQVFK